MILGAFPVRPGKSDAKVRCDECGVEIDIPIRIVKQGVGKQQEYHSTTIKEEGPLNRKLAERGWRVLKKKHICPACANEGKADGDEGEEMAVKVVKEAEVVPGPGTALVPAQITRETRRAIRGLLDEVYDIEAGRYRGAETDKTVAETVGGGCLTEWVEAERRDGYGDGGGNEA